MGLIEEDWLDTLVTVIKLKVNYKNYVEVTNKRKGSRT